MNNQQTNIPASGTGATAPVQNNTAPAYTGTSATTSSSVPTTNTQSTSASGNMGEKVGGGVRDVFAGIHGAGESLRGGLVAAVDKAFGDTQGVQKDDAIARKGESEMRTGQFTKNV